MSFGGWRSTACCLALLGWACGQPPSDRNGGTHEGASGTGNEGGGARADAGGSANAGEGGNSGASGSSGTGGDGGCSGSASDRTYQWRQIDEEIWAPDDLTVELVSAQTVSADHGELVRFVGLAERRYIFADTTDDRFSLLVGGWDSCPVSLLRLPPSHPGFRIVAVIDSGTVDGYVLGCGYQRCGLFEAPAEGRTELIFLPNSEFSGGVRYRSLTNLDVRLCASGPDVPVLCFDGETWTDDTGAPADPEAVPGIEAPAGRDPLLLPPPIDPFEDEGAASCPSDSEVTEPLLASRVGWDGVLRAVTSGGRIVYGAWDTTADAATRCYYVTQAIATPVDFEIESCGLYENPRLLTESQLLGPTNCAID